MHAWVWRFGVGANVLKAPNSTQIIITVLTLLKVVILCAAGVLGLHQENVSRDSMKLCCSFIHVFTLFFCARSAINRLGYDGKHFIVVYINSQV
jgi:hypothetical protein